MVKVKILALFVFITMTLKLLPENTTILASNKKSKIQAISFTNKNSKVWAVQYHPEFDPLVDVGFDAVREKKYYWMRVFIITKKEFESYKNFFSNIEKFKGQKIPLNISDNLVNRKMHTLELSNWLNYLKNEV